VPFTVTRKAERIPITGLGRLTIGTSVPIAADPEEPARFVILWERP